MIALIPALVAAVFLGGRNALAQTLDQHSFGFKFAGSVSMLASLPLPGAHVLL